MSTGKNLLELGGKIRRYTGTIPRLGPRVLLDIARAQRKLNRLAADVKPEAPWEAPRAAEWDGQTMRTWLDRNVRTRAARSLFGIACSIAWGAPPEQLSLLHVLFYISGAGSLELILDTEGGAQQDRFAGGSQQVALWLAEQLGDRVRLSEPVRRIDQSDTAVRIVADACEAARRAGDRRGPPEPRRANRLRAGASAQPRPAHAADAAGHDHEVPGRLRLAVLARGRAERRGRLRPRSDRRDLRQLSNGRLARCAGRLHDGQPGARGRRAAVGAPPRSRARLLRPALR